MSDSLQSKAFARLLDITTEGPAVGLVDGLRSITLDGTPVQNSDGSLNFQGFKYTERTGTANQDYIPGFPASERTVSVGVRIYENTPVTRTVTDPNVDWLGLIIGVPMLQRTDRDDGEVVATEVRLAVEVQPNGGSWQPAYIGQERLALKTAGGSTTGGVGANLLTQETTAARASVRVLYTHGGGMVGVMKYRLEHRAVGAPAWTLVRESTLSSHIDTDRSNRWNTYYIASETTTIDITPGSLYEFRLTKISDTATLSQVTMSGDHLAVTNRIVINGISSSRYQRQASIALPAGGAPWNVRVRRLTEDSDDSYRQNETWWDSYVEVSDAKLAYPYCAGFGIELDSEQISNIPTRGYDMKGRIIRVPTNYNPDTREYTGSWDGTFKLAWTDNPAWIFYDLLTHTRYGLGKYVGTDGVYKWDLYAIAQYCDGLVDDGFGGQEPRFRCNLYLSTREEAYKVLQDLASVFRGMIYWASGTIYVAQDCPRPVKYHYSPANVVDGTFTYSGSSAKAIHTVALVTWNDPADLYRQKVEYVPDEAGIQRYGVIQTEAVAVGCTSRGQAVRVGEWLLYSERSESEVVTFKAGLDTAPRRPGDVIAIADPGRAGVRYGGRLLAASTTQVTIDEPVNLLAGQTYTLATVSPDMQMQEAVVTNASGLASVLNLATPLPEAPLVGSMWTMSCDDVQTQLFGVLTINEVEPHIVEVTALAHDPSKYPYVESGKALQPRSISVLNSVPASPQNIAVREALYRRGTLLATRLLVSWSPVDTANRYLVQWRRNGGQVVEAVVTEVGFEIEGAQEGQEYTISVYALNPLGNKSSSPASLVHSVSGKASRPSDVSGFVVARTGQQLTYAWRPITDLDAARYELRAGESWEAGIVIGSVPHPANTFTALAPRGGRAMIKAIDTSGNESLNEAFVIAPDQSGINVVVEHDEGAAEWPGALDGTEIYSRSSSPTWDATEGTWDESGTWDGFSTVSGVALISGRAEGSYTSQVIDIGYVAASLVALSARVEILGPLTTQPWSALTQPWSHYVGNEWIWRGPMGSAGADYEVRTSDDGLAWSEWALFTPGTYRFRYVQLRVVLSWDVTTYPNFRPMLSSLHLLIDVPDRVEHYADVSVPATGLALAFDPEFVGVSTVQVTLQDAALGDYYKVTSKTISGVTIQVFDGSDVPKIALVDVDVFGYGERN